MKAIVCEKYGKPDVLHLAEVKKPVPGADEVLIKVHAASVNAADWHLLTADIFMVRLMMGLFKPKRNIPGADVAGEVVAAGNRVKFLKPGDAVFGDILGHRQGSFAEYALGTEKELVLKPANLTYEEAAAVPLAGITALQALRDAARLKPDQEVLIQGSAGGVGTFAVQLAKYLGARVTTVCSTRNLEQSRSLGADEVIDYTQEDVTRGNKLYDLIVAVNGFHPLRAYKRILKKDGHYLMIGGSTRQIFQGLLLGSVLSMGSTKELKAFSAKSNAQDLGFLRDLILKNKLRPVIDKRFPLDKTADAMQYLGEGHARGKVVIYMEQH
jgi:NADPH:quinone reductase-like Zn-dependent oxidoreductase